MTLGLSKKPACRILELSWAKLYVALAILQVIVTIPILTATLAKVIENPSSTLAQTSYDPKLLVQLKSKVRQKLVRVIIENVWFIIYELWKLWLVIDGVSRSNTLTIIATAVFTIFSSGLGIMQVIETEKWGDAPHTNFYLQLAMTTIVGVIIFPVAYVAYILTKEYGWAVIERVGTDRQLQDMYYRVQCFELLIKINLFFEVFLIIFFGVISSLVDVKLTAGAAVLAFAALAMLIFARLGITYEAHWMMILFFIFTVFIIFVNLSTIVLVTDNEDPWYTMCIYASASSFILCITGYTVVRCKMNFHKGLKPHVRWFPFTRQQRPTDAPDSRFQESLLKTPQTHRNVVEKQQQQQQPTSSSIQGNSQIFDLQSPTSLTHTPSPPPRYEQEAIDFTEYFDYLDMTKNRPPSSPDP